MKLGLASVSLAITAFLSSPCSHAADETRQLAPTEHAYAIQVGGATVAVIPAGSESIESTSISTTHDRETGATTLTGDAKIIIKVAGKPAVTISAAELTMRPQK
ncbi:MAG: hypothetical protein WCO60_09535 [Verrucomicrobiota bacterium]